MDNPDFFDEFAALMAPAELDQLRRMGMGRAVGFGEDPALLIIDVQNYIVGKTGPDDPTDYPSACPGGAAAVTVIARIADAFRKAQRPVIYTKSAARRDGRDMGMKLRKRGILDIDGWYLDGTKGNEIAPGVAPHPDDLVLPKGKQSGFHGTPLLNLLIAARIDTVVITGGSTSNCVRATAIDSFSHNFRTIVVKDAVVDRIRISHLVNLMDIARQLGDVVSSDAVVAYVQSLPPPGMNRLPPPRA